MPKISMGLMPVCPVITEDIMAAKKTPAMSRSAGSTCMPVKMVTTKAKATSMSAKRLMPLGAEKRVARVRLAELLLFLFL